MSKEIMAIWGMIVVLVCASLIFISNGLRDKTLLKLEKNIKMSAREYIKNNDISIKLGNTYIITVDDLINQEYIQNDENLDKYCIKKVLVSRNIIMNEYLIEKKCDEKDG